MEGNTYNNSKRHVLQYVVTGCQKQTALALNPS